MVLDSHVRRRDGRAMKLPARARRLADREVVAAAARCIENFATHHREGARPLLERFGLSPLTGDASTRPLRRQDADYILVAMVVCAVRRAGVRNVLDYSAEKLGLSWEQVRWQRVQARRRGLLHRADELTERGCAVAREALAG